MTTKLGQQTSQENKEGNNSDGSGKEEDASNSLPGSTQVYYIRYKYMQFFYTNINFLRILFIYAYPISFEKKNSISCRS